MRLDRLGASHPTRLSFLRSLVRRATREGWRVRRAQWSMDDAGYGCAVYALDARSRTYSLVAFSTPLEESRRTDRVIAEAWDTSYVLYDGVPDADEVERLRANVPLQEAGRYCARDLVLARANKSVRLFEAVVDALASGRQPDAAQLMSVGYLMRTTAVYGNGKFGIADRDEIVDRPELAGPFQAEMLTVWLIRSFTIDLAEHVAARRSPGRAARLDPALRRRLGVGNATGLGMAPFLVRHPVLMHNWFFARETALARVRALPTASPAANAGFIAALAAMIDNVGNWRTADQRQQRAIAGLAADLAELERKAPAILARLGAALGCALSLRGAAFFAGGPGSDGRPVAGAAGRAGRRSDRADVRRRRRVLSHRGAMSCRALKAQIEKIMPGRADMISASDPRMRVSGTSPRKSWSRAWVSGSASPAPTANSRSRSRATSSRSAHALEAEPESASVADFLLRLPEWRHVVRRAQTIADVPLRRNSRQSDRRGDAADRSAARQAGVFRRSQFRSPIGPLAAHRAVRGRAVSRGRRGVTELSCNEVESLALKVGRVPASPGASPRKSAAARALWRKAAAHGPRRCSL